ncbi:hypothetical protein INT45_006679 [Circinella minor]|uniref:Uncharacterized protein n=1 Tax=Circinella minor TaxID=1195481 RepID=A0A8H7RV13_9FUNG|nr:hypothetical protein INT45_006679 [Circinella minor]
MALYIEQRRRSYSVITQRHTSVSNSQPSIDDYMDTTEYDYGGPEQPYIGEEVRNNGNQSNEEAVIHKEIMDEDVDSATPTAVKQEDNDGTTFTLYTQV